jgi:diguanylate cyclase (GGDEF)-like protein
MRHRKPSASPEPVQLWLTVGVCLILLAIAFLSTRMAADLGQAADLHARSLSRVTALTRLSSLLKEAETSQRDYLLTGRAEYLDDYAAAREQLGGRFSELAELTSGDPEQARHVHVVRAAATARLERLDRAIAVRRARGFDAAAALADPDRGAQLMAAIRNLEQAMERADDEALAWAQKAEASRPMSLAAIWGLTAIAFAAAATAGWCLHRDVGRWRRAEHDLRFAAGHDALTGLCNRREFDRALGHALARARRTGAPLALAAVDVDRFKSVNDTLGHLAGDKVLRALALRLRDGFRDADLISRTGGEEFAAILQDLDEQGAFRVAERVRARVAAGPVNLSGAHKGRFAPVTVSIGIAVFPRDGSTKQALMRAADEALYAAKQAGRNRVCLAGTARTLDRDGGS